MMKLKALFILILLPAFIFGQVKYNDKVVTEDLIQKMEMMGDEDLIEINIRLTEQFPLDQLYPSVVILDKETRRQVVINELKNFTHEQQKSLVSYLNLQAQSNKAVILHEFWIANVINCKANKEVIAELSVRNDVARIDWDEARVLVENHSVPAPPGIAGPGNREITYNVLKVNADDVWALGFYGEDVIVSVIDTGVNYNHADLQDHMWEDPDYPNHGYDFHNNDNNPMDDHGHGTHCAGTVAGDGTAGSQTGMAPEATVMALKVLDSGGSGQESSVWEAIEFTVEHGADIISMSLGWSHSWNPDRPTWRTTLDNALAAGVVASIAAGNEGGSPSSPDDVRTPGDCPPPWLNPDQTLTGGLSAVVCVGATDQSDNLAYFSSIGPVTWENIDPFNDYPFNPEMGLLRPDVSAPGVDVKSCNAFNVNGYTTMSGTSMATPGVAGVMALLMSKNPQLTPEEMGMSLELTSLDLGANGKDNYYGAGRVDALEAINYVNYPGPVYYDHTINDANGNGEVEAGENVLLSIEMYNGSEGSYSNVEVTLSSESSYVSITDDNENYGNFDPDEYKTIADGFAFDLADNTPGNMNLEFVVSATDGNENWTSSFIITSYGPALALGSVSIDDTEEGNGNFRLDPGETADIIIEVANPGQTILSDILTTVESGSDYITLNDFQINIDNIEAGNTEDAVFNLTASEDAPVGSVADFHFEASAGNYNDEKDVVMSIGLIVEDWETNTFDQFDWSFSGNANWTLTSSDPYEGNYSAQSGSIGDSQNSTLVLNYTSGSDDVISFYRKVSSETSYDYLNFYIDGSLQESWSGEVAWGMVEYDVPAGEHTFTWEYDKDWSVSNGQDRAWIDWIILPPPDLPTANAGPDAAICMDEAYQLDGSAENYNSIEWTTSGDGEFDDIYILNPVYSPGFDDLSNGEVTLTLTAYGDNGNISNSMVLTILELPDITVESDPGVCNGEAASITYFLTGIAPWTITFEDMSTMDINESPYTYEISPQTTITHSIVHVSDAYCENTVGVEYTIEVYDLPEVDLGPDQELCFNYTAELDAGNPGATYEWSTGESSQVIIVDSTGIDNDGYKTISVNVTNADGCTSTDEVVLNFYECSGIDEWNMIRDLSVFPVPNNGAFTLRFYSAEKQEIVLKIINPLGMISHQETLDIQEGLFTKHISLNDISSNIYYLILETEAGTINKKLMVSGK